MFLFFYKMKNGEDGKEEDIMEEGDGNNTYRWEHINEETRERGMELRRGWKYFLLRPWSCYILG